MISYDDEEDQMGLFSQMLGGALKKDKAKRPKRPSASGENDNPLSTMNKFDKSMIDYKMNTTDKIMPEDFLKRDIESFQ